MRGAGIRDNTLVVQERPDPVAGDGEVLFRVRAAGLNGADPMQVAGRYPPPPGVPQDIPGMELAGEVVDVPNSRAVNESRSEAPRRRCPAAKSAAVTATATVCIGFCDVLEWTGARCC